MRELAAITLQLQDAKDFAATKARRAAVLKLVGEQMHSDGETMAQAQDPNVFAYIVHSAADKLAEVSVSWKHCDWH